MAQSFLYQVYTVTKYQLLARYRNTFAGILWVVLAPIFVFIVQTIAFRFILKIELKNFPLFLLSNLIPWFFLTSTLQICTTLLEHKRDILRSYNAPPLIWVTGQVLDNFINFLLTFFILFIPIGFMYGTSLTTLISLLPAFFFLFTGTLLLSSILSYFQIFFRDLKFIVIFATNTLFFLTPIFYPIDFIPKFLWPFMNLNILYTIIRPINTALYPSNSASFTYAITNVIFLNFILLGINTYLWRNKSNEFFKEL